MIKVAVDFGIDIIFKISRIMNCGKLCIFKTDMTCFQRAMKWAPQIISIT